MLGAGHSWHSPLLRLEASERPSCGVALSKQAACPRRQSQLEPFDSATERLELSDDQASMTHPEVVANRTKGGLGPPLGAGGTPQHAAVAEPVRDAVDVHRFPGSVGSGRGAGT